MNEALSLEFGPFGLSEGKGLSFLSFPSKQSAKQLAGSTGEAVRNIAEILEQLLTAAVEKRTAAEFIALRDSTFPHYTGVMIALATLVKAVVPAATVERLTAESLSEQEAELRDKGAAAFGTTVRDQAIFTVWTLWKINGLGQKLSTLPTVPDDRKEDDARFLQMFIFHGLRTRFHLDCLTASIRHNLPIFPEVLNAISDGLRSGVDAYAWIRQSVDVRCQHEEPVLPFLPLDEEDREFVDASARDMASDSSLNGG